MPPLRVHEFVDETCVSAYHTTSGVVGSVENSHMVVLTLFCQNKYISEVLVMLV